MKKINLDENYKQNLIRQFTQYVNNTRFTDNRIDFTTVIPNILPEITEKPKIIVSEKAFLKMLLYTSVSSTEIAWQGTVQRTGNIFTITDVFLYPQTVSGATVNTDQVEYQNWLNNIEEDETINTMRFQGHSHVNMATQPSGVDLNLYNDILQTLQKNDYYIFVIMNKSLSFNWFLYDLAQNTIFENNDIVVELPEINQVYKDKDEFCKQPVPAWQNNYYGYNGSFGKLLNSPTTTYKQPIQQSTTKAKYPSVDDLFDELDNKYKNSKLLRKSKKK